RRLRGSRPSPVPRGPPSSLRIERRGVMNTEQQTKQWSQIVAQAWADESFKRRLLADPAAVLKEQGIGVPAGVGVRVVENTDQVRYLTLPNRSGKGELSEEELAAVAGGAVDNFIYFDH